MNRMHCVLLFLTLTAGLTAAASPAGAQVLTTLFAFTGTNGSSPRAGLAKGSDGNFYGTTGNGGSSNEGTVFKITPTGTLTVLHDFPALNGHNQNSDGAAPVARLIQGSDGNFYGTTDDGGSSYDGTAFKITPSGAFTTLHDFGQSTSDGAFSVARLIQGSDGIFYGTTSGGGVSGYGAVFKMTPMGTVTTLYSFSAIDANGFNSDGAIPGAGLTQGTDGNFYGTTANGGPSGDGTVFKMTPLGALTTLIAFTGTNGGSPLADLIQGSDGNFYGTTQSGGASDDGTVFKMTPAGTLTTLVNFTGAGGAAPGQEPGGGLVQESDGSFYGTTVGGGGGTGDNGTIFRITPSGTLITLYSFIDNNQNNEGEGPNGPLIVGSDGNFYGTTAFSGDGDGGTIFRLNVFTLLTVTSLNPVSAPINGPAFPLKITGANFTGNTTVTFGGMPVTVTSHAATQLEITVPASAITTQGTKTVSVTDPVNGSASTVFTVTSGWNAQDVAAVADGTARLLWDRSDGAAGIWIVNATDAQISVGPTYGPYTGWTAQDITAAADGTSRILWNRYDGATGVWAMDAHGNETTVGPTYGPFSGWKAIDLAAAPDGTSRLMWRYTNGQAGLLSLNATGGEIISGRSYGPYTGWTATAVGAAGDGTARILWTRSDGAMGIWTMDAGDLQLSVGPTYGPYSDSHGHWTATDLSTSSDGTSQVLWKRSDGAIGVWSFSASNVQTLVGPVYGPYAGFTVAALDAASDKARVLWVQSNRAAGVWSFGTNDIESLIGPVYGPY